MQPRPPNILYLHSHDTGRAVQPYGSGVPTPRIQRLAEEGVLFRQAFCAAPTCSASRACLLTGQYAHSCGMFGLAHRGFSLDDYSHHVVHTLRGAGYHSALIGEQHVSKDPAAIGYDLVHRIDTNNVDEVAPRAVELLRGDLTVPFFLSVGFFETHRPFPDAEPGAARYVAAPPGLPDTPEVRDDAARFHASAASLDRGVGAVLDALVASGLAESTLVICTTDHGIAFPGAKATLRDAGIGVMLILRGPGFRGGEVSDALVSHIDIFPTICDVAGISHPDWLQGRSLVPLVSGEVDAIRDAIFAEATYHAAYEPQRAIRTPRWKLIRRYHDYPTPVLVNTDDGPSKDLLLEHGWRDRPVPAEELYDVVFDPGEVNNLAGDPELRDVREELGRRLELWMRETGDPLLDGAIPLPEGFEINDQAQLSPSEPTRLAVPRSSPRAGPAARRGS